MGIRIDISAETPLSDDDRDILAGLSEMMLAIANRQSLADQPETPDEAEQELSDERPTPCGRLDEDGGICVREAGHSGRHKYRPIALSYSGKGLKH
jgi:hypothetical protein